MSEQAGLPETEAKRSTNSQVRHRAYFHPCSSIWRKVSKRPSGPSHSFKNIPLIFNLTDSAFDSSPATSLFPQESQNLNKK